jgi:hypothetical protein
MPIDPMARPEELRERGLRWWSDDNVSIGWKGHIFLSGRPGGEASIDHLRASLRSRELPETLGVYGLFIYEHRSRRWQPRPVAGVRSDARPVPGTRERRRATERVRQRLFSEAPH